MSNDILKANEKSLKNFIYNNNLSGLYIANFSDRNQNPLESLNNLGQNYPWIFINFWISESIINEVLRSKISWKEIEKTYSNVIQNHPNHVFTRIKQLKDYIFSDMTPYMAELKLKLLLIAQYDKDKANAILHKYIPLVFSKEIEKCKNIFANIRNYQTSFADICIKKNVIGIEQSSPTLKDFLGFMYFFNRYKNIDRYSDACTGFATLSKYAVRTSIDTNKEYTNLATKYAKLLKTLRNEVPNPIIDHQDFHFFLDNYVSKGQKITSNIAGCFDIFVDTSQLTSLTNDDILNICYIIDSYSKDWPDTDKFHELIFGIAYVLKEMSINMTSYKDSYIQLLQDNLLKEIKRLDIEKNSPKENVVISKLNANIDELEYQLKEAQIRIEQLLTSIVDRDKLLAEKQNLLNDFQLKFNKLNKEYQDVKSELDSAIELNALNDNTDTTLDFSIKDSSTIIPTNKEIIELTKNKTVLIVAGHDIWQSKIKALFPNFFFIPKNNLNFDVTILKNTDLLILNTIHCSHSLFYRIKNNINIGRDNDKKRLAFINNNNLDYLKVIIQKYFTTTVN